MRKKERTTEAVKRLEALYPDAICSLTYTDAFQLLIATRLSAQCTDKRVNMVTPALFAEFPDAKSMGEAPLSRVEELIKTCGLYKTKAKDLVAIGKEITERFGTHVHILDWALHLDENTPHIHERHVFDCKNRYGELCPQQEKALEESIRMAKEQMEGSRHLLISL